MTESIDTLPASLQRALGDHFHLVRELGRGGMGVVFLATDLTLDRQVAVKAIHPDHSANRSAAARFLAEARTVAKLRHSNIVSVLTAGEADGLLFYVMDYSPGETLRQRLNRTGRLDIAAAVKIASDIAAALDVAAEAGVVHRDLKPENILLEGPDDDPRALLTDFGIARLMDDGGGQTHPGAVMGTPAYMSPEQAAGEQLDARSDLYSLGIVTYEMLAGTPPFSGPHRVVISKQIMDPPPPLASVRTDVPKLVAAAVMQALDKTPEERWQSGRMFRRALAGEQPTPATGHRWDRRWRLLGLVGLAALSVAVAAIALLRPTRPAAGVNPRHSILVLPFDNVRDEPALGWLGDGSVNMLALALSQWHDLTVVDQDRVHDLLTTERRRDAIGLDLARRLARKAGVWTVVLGDYTRAGDSLHVVARLYDVASGNRIEVVQADGPAQDDVRPLFDELATKLLDLTGAPRDLRTTVAAVTTQSLEAYRAYLLGITALSDWRLNDAATELGHAVTLDSTFSLAYYRLALTRGWMGTASDTLGRNAIRRASQTASRLPARDRQLIDAYRALIEGEFDRSQQLYGDLVAKDSLDADAWYGLGDASFHRGYETADLTRMTRSLRVFKRVVALDSNYTLAYEHMAAMLTDASRRDGWLSLTPNDSFVPVMINRKPVIDSAAKETGIRRARHEAVEAARAWTEVQPNTPRAHFALYQALLTGENPPAALREVGQMRAFMPPATQPLLSFLEARARFIGGDVAGAAELVRGSVDRVTPETLRQFDFGRELTIDVMGGTSPLQSLGDLEGAAKVVALGKAMQDAYRLPQDSARDLDSRQWETSRLAQLYAAAGGPVDALRNLWLRTAGAAQRARPEQRQKIARTAGAAAAGLFVGSAGDSGPLDEYQALTGKPLPYAMQALLAATRGDSAAARRILKEGPGQIKDAKGSGYEQYAFGDLRPLVAETYLQLGEYSHVVETLRDFTESTLATRGFDPRWVLMPRVRLLRAEALEKLGRLDEAAREYRHVADQWNSADSVLQPFVQQARQGLARIGGSGKAVGQ